MDKAKASYDADVAEARREYIQQLERAKAQYMRDRDLEGATAVQRLIDGVGASSGSGLTPSLIVDHRWSRLDASNNDRVDFSFMPDGQLRVLSGPPGTGQRMGGWRIENDRFISQEGHVFEIQSIPALVMTNGRKNLFFVPWNVAN